MNTSTSVNIQQALKEGWEGTKKHFLFFIGLVLLTSALSVIPGIIGNMIPEAQEEGVLSFIVMVASWVMQLLVAMGSVTIALAVIAGQKPSYSLLIPDGNKIIPFIAASILYAIIVTLGFIVLIIPGIYFTIKYQFYSYRIIDTNDGILDALRQSGELTKGVKWQLFGFMLLLAIINILGALAIFIGLLVTIPVTMLATASAYRQLSNRFMPAVQSAPGAPVATPPTV